ncbi:MAG: hypothetical protein R3Y13_06040 [bacterium]
MFMKKKAKEKIKLKENTINLIKSDDHIDCTNPINLDKLLDILSYCCDLEVSLVQEIEENGEKYVSKSYLEEVCSAVDDLNINTDEIDLEYLNQKLGFGSGKIKKYSIPTEQFLKEFVLPKLSLSEYNSANIGEIVQYIISEIEGPLADKLEDSALSSGDKTLLQLASDAVTEITTRTDLDK